MIPETKGAARLAHVDSCESEDGREAVEKFWQKAITSRSEGLMVKVLQPVFLSNCNAKSIIAPRQGRSPRRR